MGVWLERSGVDMGEALPGGGTGNYLLSFNGVGVSGAGERKIVGDTDAGAML